MQARPLSIAEPFNEALRLRKSLGVVIIQKW